MKKDSKEIELLKQEYKEKIQKAKQKEKEKKEKLYKKLGSEIISLLDKDDFRNLFFDYIQKNNLEKIKSLCNEVDDFFNINYTNNKEDKSN
ncbi:hypothetical protein MWJ18_001463 [Campylobacter lari]|uniref:hypothetical protein n=1 Tax=Campylobacter lari TaxID=201 RepID=UPI0010788741|nr:hypothetical protein [Campylobacter lari]EAC1840656.1 hypothetical protein [Campylobacter lari]EAH7781228.1 hypothetical protein [Campylobacter lari]EAH8420834.1 hypothetical protein [Campylobacter lari]EAI0904490.1 hypothetical protein [Campylobacter lari]EAI2357852.1 hypothetical protein [Campylobacter lari]